MLIPYRAKNPIKRFPIATVSIIGLNVLVYLLTTESFLAIREDVVKAYGCLVGETPLYTFITSTFLHADPIHLIGNMLFLWVFGPSVEDRLGIGKYLGLYFVTGIIGDLLQTVVITSAGGANLHSIGASGCIMGVVGAYWYMYSWSPICCAYWLAWFYRGLTEIKAFWVIGFYVLLDVVDGVLGSAMGASGGVAHFAHIGGTAAGALICMAFRVKRDSSEVSEAKALHADAKDLYNMPLHALDAMLSEEPDNPEMLRALLTKASKMGDKRTADNAMANAGPGLIDKDASLVAVYLTDLHGDAKIYRSIQLLRLAGLVERQGDALRASQIYAIIADSRPTDPEAETALFRLALFSWNVKSDPAQTKTYVEELKRRFPHGELIFQAEALLKKLS